MKQLRNGLVALAAMLTVGLMTTAPAYAASDTPYIAIISKGFSQQYWQAVKRGAEDEAKKKGARITFQGPPTESDVAIQMDQLTNALNKRPDAIGFAALDSQAAAPMLQQAKSQGIPVIAFDSGVKSDVPATTVATNNRAAGAEAAKHMAKLLNDKGTVGLIIHDQTSNSGVDRRDGFVNWMKKNAPGIKLLSPQYSNSDMSKAANITKAILTSHPHINGLFASNEASAAGMALGIRESGRKNVAAVGFDSGKAQIDAIKNGVMAGSITQNPVGMGAQLVDAALKVINGKPVPKKIDTGFYWYDKANLGDPQIQKNIYE